MCWKPEKEDFFNSLISKRNWQESICKSFSDKYNQIQYSSSSQNSEFKYRVKNPTYFGQRLQSAMHPFRSESIEIDRFVWTSDD